jgi:hypothetical protein
MVINFISGFVFLISGFLEELGMVVEGENAF